MAIYFLGLYMSSLHNLIIRYAFLYCFLQLKSSALYIEKNNNGDFRHPSYV